ncbi:MAG TPA: hypothetical protein VEI98_15875 [Xanthobacteraceae bacterium]|nr:hypothetical protein [Xanthobacteraceae bacterium]
MHWFGENILISMMVLLRNAVALRTDTLRRDLMFFIASVAVTVRVCARIGGAEI